MTGVAYQSPVVESTRVKDSSKPAAALHGWCRNSVVRNSEMTFQIETAGLHEAERLGDTIRQFDVAPRLRRIFHEAEHPLPHARQIRVAALREGAQQVERRGRLTIGVDLAARVGRTRFRSEGVVVDDIAAVARQFDAVTFLGWRRARLGELAGDTADLHHRRGGGISQHHRHLRPRKKSRDIGGCARRALGASCPYGKAWPLQRRLLLQVRPRRQAPAARVASC